MAANKPFFRPVRLLLVFPSVAVAAKVIGPQPGRLDRATNQPSPLSPEKPYVTRRKYLKSYKKRLLAMDFMPAQLRSMSFILNMIVTMGSKEVGPWLMTCILAGLARA